jgi:cytochrome c-type biogenesis protein CcmH
MKSLLVAAAVLAGVVAIPASPASAASQASLPDIEDEVMCPTCGVPLNHAFSPQAERQREFIRAEIARGRDKEQIKQALVAEFGPEVLAEPSPDERSFDIVAYLVPAAAVGVGCIAIWLALRRWRRRGPDEPGTAAALSAADSARVERDLRRYEP